MTITTREFPPLAKDLTWIFTQDYQIQLPKGTSYVKYQTFEDFDSVMVYPGDPRKGSGEYLLPKESIPQLEEKIQELYQD